MNSFDSDLLRLENFGQDQLGSAEDRKSSGETQCSEADTETIRIIVNMQAVNWAWREPAWLPKPIEELKAESDAVVIATLTKGQARSATVRWCPLRIRTREVPVR